MAGGVAVAVGRLVGMGDLMLAAVTPRSRDLVIIVGPTASGKTALAVEIAIALDGEIVSADALQVYRGLDIGTAKPSAKQRRRVRHHCLDVASPEARFSAGDFARMATAAMESIRARGRRPIVVGGSGLYVNALVEGLAPLPRAEPAWRRTLLSVGRRRGDAFLFDMLACLDPREADRVGGNDRQRILRAVEITLRSGVPYSSLRQRHWGQRTTANTWIGVTRRRPTLYARIEQRVDEMLAEGWLEEVRGLLQAGLSPQAHCLQAIGYRQLAAHLAGEVRLDAAREQILVATRRYAKRQLTWFRNQTPAQWFDLGEEVGDTAVEAQIMDLVVARGGRLMEDRLVRTVC